MQSATKDCNGITFTVSCNELSGKAFVDSGCTFNAVSTSYADQCKMEITEYENDLVCTIGGGQTLTVKRCVARVKFDLGDIGRIDSYVFVLDHLPMECDVLFGMDFLRTVNPIIDWKTGRLDVTT
jgi:predicted aspartyl protease